VRLSPSGSARSLSLSDGTSGLLTALGIETGLREFPLSRSTFGRSRNLRKVTEDFVTSVNELVSGAESSELEKTIAAVFTHAVTRDGIRSTRAATGEIRSLGFSLGSLDKGFVSIDEAALNSAIRQRGQSLQRLFNGRSDQERDGLLSELDGALNGRLQDLQLSLAQRGERPVDFLA